MPYSHGRTTKDVRRFCREHGVKPTCGNVERMQREITRTPAENEALKRCYKETGRPSLVDQRGRDMKQVVKGIVRRELDKNR